MPDWLILVAVVAVYSVIGIGTGLVILRMSGPYTDDISELNAALGAVFWPIAWVFGLLLLLEFIGFLITDCTWSRTKEEKPHDDR